MKYMYIVSYHFMFNLLVKFSVDNSFDFVMPLPFSMGVHIVSPLSIRMSVPSIPYVTLLVSVRYLFKGLVYWIEILNTGI